MRREGIRYGSAHRARSRFDSGPAAAPWPKCLWSHELMGVTGGHVQRRKRGDGDYAVRFASCSRRASDMDLNGGDGVDGVDGDD